MVQCFPELQRVHKGLDVNIGFVMFMQVIPFKHKACNLPVPEPDILKVAAHAHEECTSKNVRGLKTGKQLDHLLS